MRLPYLSRLKKVFLQIRECIVEKRFWMFRSVDIDCLLRLVGVTDVAYVTVEFSSGRRREGKRCEGEEGVRVVLRM